MGHYFEEFKVDDVFITPSRTITEQDIQQFADLTEDHNPVHTDPEFGARSMFGSCISHGPLMVGFTFGLLSRIDLLDGTIIALKDLQWSFNAPIRAGDAVHIRARVKEARLSRKAPDRGTVTLAIEVINQDAVTVQAATAVTIIATADYKA